MSAGTTEAEQQLAALASGLCLDAGIRLEVGGERWSYDPLRNVLRIAETSLREQGGDWCAGRLVNEVGHYWLTRHDLFPVDFPSAPIGRILMDALEDGRVDGWMAARYPGSRAWLQRVVASSDGPLAGPVPMILTFCRECALEPGRGWAPARYPLPPPVADALAQTREARRAYAAIAPSTRVGETRRPDASRHYQERVAPHLLRPLWMPSPFEAETRTLALEALALAEAEILPAAAALFEQDREQLEAWLAANPLEHQRLQERLDPHAARRALGRAQAAAMPACPASADVQQTAAEILEAITRGENAHQRVCEGCGPPRIGPPRPGAPRIPRGRPGVGPSDSEPLELPPPPPTDYNRALAEMSSQIARLVTLLERVLKPRQRLRTRSGYPSGRRVDMRRLLAFEADPRQYDRLWVRSSIPERRRVAFSLLVDLSGSMEGEKTHAALLGTVLLAETLARLSVPFAINGFQNVIIPLAPFHAPFDRRVRDAIASMPGEVSGSRPGGNNVPGYNDDGPCVLEAANELLGEQVEERILLVVSDGQPAGSRSNEDDLRRTIHHLTAPGVPLELLGIGLGPDTEHVSDYYPQSVASVPLDRFADEIGRLIARGLRVAI